ncbi:Golgin imh1 [Cladophialophora chaetospira]|uniref:Golgin imh1 n=1 Tax=Cladophialophora chaetospira TaxID=386627 RepID=A0AA39CC41_9EURO|nr:Golgin imh1 [Cladophialophora chaetospira]
MFSRLKGAIDSRIAEEQARQRQAQQATRTPPRRRPQAQNGSSQRGASRQREQQDNASNEKGPDPSEFEPEFAVGTDESAVPSRVATPQPPTEVPNKEKEQETQKEPLPDHDGLSTSSTVVEAAEGKAPDTNGTTTTGHLRPQDLPTDVRVKLRKLERMESKYADLLKAYRTAHARIQTVESFEASLRENTPLTSINDPNALVEYLNQINLKSDMVVDELKRVTADRDKHKKKFQAKEEEAQKLVEEVAELKNKQAETVVQQAPSENEKSVSIASPQPSTVGDNVSAKAAAESEQTKSPSSAASRIASFSLFSPRQKPTSPPPKETSEEFFSYESEQSKIEAELQERQAEVDDLKKEIVNLKGDLKVARESTESMVESLETATRELHTLRDAKDKFDSSKTELQSRIDELETIAALNTSRTDEVQKELDSLKAQKNDAMSQLVNIETQVKKLETTNTDLKEQISSREKDANILNEKLSQKDSIVKDLEDTLAIYKSAERQEVSKKQDDQSSEKKLATMQKIMDTLRGQLDKAEKTVAELNGQIRANEDAHSNRPSTKVLEFLDESTKSKLDTLKTREDVVKYISDNFGLQKAPSLAAPPSQSTIPSPAPSEAGTGLSKKKNKKKKKGKGQQLATEEAGEADAPVKVSEILAEVEDPEPASNDGVARDLIAKLEQEISELRAELSAKVDAIDRLSDQLRNQEDMKEEIETLRDDLLHQGQEHVEARDALKEAQTQKNVLQENVDKLEKEVLEARTAIASGADKEKAHKQIVEQFDDLKNKCSALENDLAASEQLAAGRFKDITDLKEIIAKAQPELRGLRNEVAELKTAKDDLKNRTGELSRLEARHEDIKAELKGLSKRLGEKDAEIKELNQKIEQETTTRTRIEKDLEKAHSDLQTSETRRQETTTHSSQLTSDLTRAKEESSSLSNKLRTLEEQLSSQSRDIASLREELTLKTALHTSSQSLVSSLRDQTHELNMQAREASTRADNLEEELSEAQRMLSERTREGQTMRMLLDQTSTGTEGRIREMKERMDKAIEERDRVEDEASVSQRRMMREVEDAKSKARDAQRSLKGVEDEKEELENRLKEWKRRRDELEEVSARASREVDEVKAAMTSLREALDESERQVRELDAQKADLRRTGDEAKERVEKLTKANKNLTEELKLAQARLPGRPGAGRVDSNAPSSRTSIDSTHANMRSPAPKERGFSAATSRSETPTTGAGAAGGLSQGTVDYVYLKNVLLQFLEQKDKGHQRQLIPVLGMLLHFDRKDEQKWMAAITAR